MASFSNSMEYNILGIDYNPQVSDKMCILIPLHDELIRSIKAACFPTVQIYYYFLIHTITLFFTECTI